MNASRTADHQAIREDIARMAALLSPASLQQQFPAVFAEWARDMLADEAACVRQLRVLADVRELDGSAGYFAVPDSDADCRWLRKFAKRPDVAALAAADFVRVLGDASLLLGVAMALHPAVKAELVRAADLPADVLAEFPLPVMPKAVWGWKPVAMAAATVLVIALTMAVWVANGKPPTPATGEPIFEPAVTARLAQPDAQAVLDTLRAGQSADDPRTRTMAAYHLARLGQSTDATVPALVAALDDPQTQALAQRGLMSLGAPAVPQMVASVSEPAFDERPAVRDALLVVLESLGPAAREKLADLAANGAVNARATAEHALRTVCVQTSAHTNGNGRASAHAVAVATMGVDEVEKLIADIEANGIRFRHAWATATSSSSSSSGMGGASGSYSRSETRIEMNNGQMRVTTSSSATASGNGSASAHSEARIDTGDGK